MISHRQYAAFFSWLAVLSLLVQGVAAQSHQPLEHFKGNRLQELRRTTFEGAKAAANSGAGFEAARLLNGLSTSGSKDDISRQAQSLLNDWGLRDQELKESRAAQINQQVRKRLLLEHQGRVDISMIEVLIEFEDFEGAASTLSAVVERPIFGNTERALTRFCVVLGLPTEEQFKILKDRSSDQLEADLKRARDLTKKIDAWDFLVTADPTAGAMYGALLKKLHPAAESIRKARKTPENNERSRFNFGRGRTMPPGLIARFGRQTGGRGQEEDQSDAQAPDPELSVQGVIESLDYLAKDDTGLAIELLELGIQVFANDPEREKLQSTLKQANAYLIRSLAGTTDSSSLQVERFTGKRKKGKAKDIFSGKNTPTYELTILPEQWEKLKNSPKEYVSATFRSEGTILKNIGVRLKGGIGSYRPLEGGNKVGLTLKMNQFVKGQKFLGLRKVVLNNSVQDDSYLREGLGYALFRKAGLPASRVGHANLIVNGEPYGLYVQIEAVTSDFLKRWFDDGKGTLYEGSYGSDVDQWDELEVDSDPELADREALRALAEAAEDAIEKGTIKPLESHLDVVAFARFMAMEVLMDHWDGYISANNYRLYHDTQTGKFYFIPHGADQLFRNTGGDLMRNSRGLVGQALMQAQDGRELYLAQVHDLLANVLDTTEAKELLAERYKTVRKLASTDAKTSNTLAEFDSTVKTTLEFFARKARLTRWQEIALDDPDLARRLQSLNQDPRRFFMGGGRGRGGRR